MSTDDELGYRDPRDAAGWRVALDVAPEDAALATRFAAWLDANPAHEREMERVELAIELARRLAESPDLLAASSERPRLRRIAFGLAAAAAAIGVVAAALWIGLPATRFDGQPTTQSELRAATVAAVAPPVNSVVVLPTGVIVDGGSVALLPFAAAGDAGSLASGLETDLAAALRGVPGLYVVAGGATAPYAAPIDLSTMEMGSQLGARGLVDARVQLSDGRVRVVAHLKDARSGAVVWQSDLDEPVDRLAHVRDVIADGIALTLLGSSAQSTNAFRTSAPAFAAIAAERSLLE